MANVNKTLLGLAVALVVSGAALAQNALQEGIKILRLGTAGGEDYREQALAKFREVLSADLSNEQALELYRSVGQDEWHMLLLERGEIQKVATFILERAKVAQVERSREIDAIQQLVDTVCSGNTSYEQRRKATLELIANHGEFAVPALVEKLANPDDPDGQIHAIAALNELGRLATMPLIEALKSEDLATRTNAAAALYHIGDRRAAPAMARLAQLDAHESVRDIARRFLQKHGITRSAVDLYIDQARNYMLNGVGAGEMSDVVWKLEDGVLTYVDVPPEIYGLELAKKAAHDALPIEPGNASVQSLVAQAYLAQAAVIEESLAQNPDNESLAPLADKVGDLKVPALAAGPQVLRQALVDAMDAGLVPVAVGAIEALAVAEEPGSLRSSPLVAALDSSDSRISYAAALALTKASGGANVPAADKVVRNLANAVAEESIRVIQVIDPSVESQQAAREASSRRGYRAVADSGAVAGMRQLLVNPNIDVVVINEVLPDRLPEDVIGNIQKDPRMAHIKVLVMAKDVEAAQDRFGDSIAAVIQGPLTGDGLVQAVDSALEDVPASYRDTRAEQVAEAASSALQTLAEGSVSIGSSLGSLAGQLDRSDAIAIPAARALGLGGTAEQLDALLAVVDGGGSLELRVAAAKAMGMILGRMQSAPANIVAALKGMLMSDADIQLRAAIGIALGKAKLSEGDKASLLDSLQRTAGKDSDM